jgi:hypothetical protein
LCKKNRKKIEKKLKKYNFAPVMRHIPYIKIAIIAFLMLFLFGERASAQLHFERTIFDFGDIKEQDGKVEYTFSFENIGEKPVVILNVMSGCGCTTPYYSRKPVLKGERAEVRVVFDPINRPGHFSKSVSILTSASNTPYTLTLRGNVLSRPKTIEELYPFDVADGLRLSINYYSFDYISRGERAEQRIGVVNTSSKPVRLHLSPRETSGLMSIEAPSQIQAGEKTEIKISYFVPPQSKRYGTLQDMFCLEVNGRLTTTFITANAIAVDKFDRDTDDISRPSCELSKKIIKFGDLKYGKKGEDSSVVISNDGETDLIIRAVEWNTNSVQCSLQPGTIIKPGSWQRITLEIDTSKCNHGVWVDRLRIITNDEQHPMQSIRVTAIIVE